MVFFMIAFWFLATQAMTYALLEITRKTHAAIAPRVRSPLVAHALLFFFRVVLLFAIMTIATGALVMLARGEDLATLPSYTGVVFWSACVLCSSLIANHRAFQT